MEDQEKQTDDHANSNGRTEITQVGQVLRSLATRQPPVIEQPVRAVPLNSAMRERIAVLIAALGDTEQPLHQQAVQELVTIGDPAVPALNEALNPRRPWLTSYRAAEALGQIGDGRATGPLIEALRHPNSNVRWGAVRALTALSDARAIFDLRRLAREDRSKTSWGESVSDAAQSALDQMRTQNVLLRGADLLKTALACVVMLVALIVAWNAVNSFRSEMRSIGHEQVAAGVVGPLPSVTASASETAVSGGAAASTAEATAAATAPSVAATTAVTGTVLSIVNVRALPSSQLGERIGILNTGDEVLFEATTPDREWYRVRLGERHADNSRIDSPDGTGWVIGSLVSYPEGNLSIEDLPATPTP